MSNKDVYWSADGSYLPEIEPHSKAKHQILEDYIKNWIVTLCGNNMGKRKTVTLIDGFCGGGMYYDKDNNNERWSGSPIRMIKMVERGLEIVKYEKLKLNYELNVKFIFIDNQQNHLDCLRIQMLNSGLEDYVDKPEKCQLICGEFENFVEHLILEVKQRKGSSFFFLDPFGYTQVSMRSIRSLISLGKSEVLYTFMIEFIRRFISQRSSSLENAFTNILEADGYYDIANLDYVDAPSQQEYLRNETLRLFRNRGSAHYVYSFALLPNATLVKYYLIHLASSPTAQRVMKDALWERNNIDLVYQFRYGVYGLGFRTPDYYEQNSRIFDIKEVNAQASIEGLNDDLMPIIYNSEDGIPFDQLHVRTMQTNPATLNHYMSYVDEQRSVEEIEVLRNGKITRAKQLKPGDVILKSRQGKLFDMRKFKRK